MHSTSGQPATPLAQFADGLVFLTRLYLAISPWVVGVSGLRSIAASNLITGVALALRAAGLASAYARTHGMAWGRRAPESGRASRHG